MESKCPCCDGNRDSWFAAEYFSCIDCVFMCEAKDLPRITAAMELARSLSNGDDDVEDLASLMRYRAIQKHVLEVFGDQS